jgi:hypothetical protein
VEIREVLHIFLIVLSQRWRSNLNSENESEKCPILYPFFLSEVLKNIPILFGLEYTFPG